MLGCEELVNNLLQATTFTDCYYNGICALFFYFQGENTGNQWWNRFRHKWGESENRRKHNV